MCKENDKENELDQLRAWMEGDRETGAHLCDRYFDMIYRFFRSKVSSAVTHDLAQNTFEALLKSGHRFQGRSSFRSFVLGIAVNVLHRHFRSKRRDRLEFDGDELSCIDLGLSPFDVVALDHDQRLLVMALRRIPINDQILIELTYWESMSSAEIGEVMGSPAPTIRARLKNARNKVEKALRELSGSKERAERTMTGLETWAEEIRRRFGPSLGLWPPPAVETSAHP